MKKKALLLDKGCLIAQHFEMLQKGASISYLAEYSRDMERAQAECTWLVSVCARSFLKEFLFVIKAVAERG